MSSPKAACLVVIATVSLVACSNLSKSDAREQIKATIYDVDDNVYCTWPAGDRHLDPHTMVFYSRENQACVTSLADANVLTEESPPEALAIMNGMTKYNYKLPEHVSFTKTWDLKFPCGKQVLGDVVAVSTENKSASASYVRTVKPNDALLQKISACTLTSTPTAGQTTETVKFTKGDDGKWAPSN